MPQKYKNVCHSQRKKVTISFLSFFRQVISELWHVPEKFACYFLWLLFGSYMALHGSSKSMATVWQVRSNSMGRGRGYAIGHPFFYVKKEILLFFY